MPTPAPFRLAVVGSGPAGCYLAQAMLRGAPELEITIFDRLPCPYGLLRYGVAADHQHTKAITRQFERIFADPRVRFAGDVELGRDLPLAALREAYDAVVLATGLGGDRELGVPGAELPGVHGSGVVTRVLNSHPGERPELPELGPEVVIVGGGNVAIDLLRFLVKDRAGYEGSDIADHALDSYLASPAARVTLVNRSAPEQAKSDPQMLKELAGLERASYRSPELEARGEEPPAEADRTAAARIRALAELVGPERPHFPGPEVALRFSTAPLRIVGEGRVEGVEIVSAAGVELIPATAVLTAIGFRQPNAQLAALLGEHAETGRVAPGLYRTGWAKRGPRGAIPENRACAKEVADEILADLASGALAPGSAAGFDALPETVRERAISAAQWAALDRHEQELAPAGRVRRKLSDAAAMIAVARGAAAPGPRTGSGPTASDDRPSERTHS
jgi:ferredoxin--NADP+ reductase